jgi:hypothetical protein
MLLFHAEWFGRQSKCATTLLSLREKGEALVAAHDLSNPRPWIAARAKHRILANLTAQMV